MRLYTQNILCLLVLFVYVPTGTWSQDPPLRADDISQYAVDAIQMVTSCFSGKNFRRPIRFGKCVFSQFTNSDIKEAVIYPKLKQLVRNIVNRTIAEEHTLKFKIINNFLNRHLRSRPRYGYRSGFGNGYSDYGGGGGGGGYGDMNRYRNDNPYDDDTNNYK